jgi:ADP-ribosylglycohydrolase
MGYPKYPKWDLLGWQIRLYSDLKHEYGAKRFEPILRNAERALKKALRRVQALPVDAALAKKEPNSLAEIRRLRPRGPRRMWETFDRKEYLDRVEGAFLGRMAGCTLGAPVEGWSLKQMEELAKENGDRFPPTDYWKSVPDPNRKRYLISPRRDYTRTCMNGVPADDDIEYTLVGLLVAEKYGPEFTTADVGKFAVKAIPIAYTAEEAAIKNLKAGVPARKAAEKDNPYCEWIGADIRCDPWAYMAPGQPDLAARSAYRDAYLSHRRNGIYGAMYFAAAISAAFAADDPMEALRIGLTEIPRECSFARAVRWALATAPKIRNYRQARAAVDRKFARMHQVHSINNACLTIWGVHIGGTDLTKVISETVAMGLDNDCTAATAGSIVGAVVGKRGIPARWTKNFNDTIHSYLTGYPKFRITDVVRRFERQAERMFGR